MLLAPRWSAKPWAGEQALLPASSRLAGGSQDSRLNRLCCALCSHFPWHHALPQDMASSPTMSQGSWAATCQATCSAPPPWDGGVVCVGRSVPTCCVHPPQDT